MSSHWPPYQRALPKYAPLSSVPSICPRGLSEHSPCRVQLFVSLCVSPSRLTTLGGRTGLGSPPQYGILQRFTLSEGHSKGMDWHEILWTTGAWTATGLCTLST